MLLRLGDIPALSRDAAIPFRIVGRRPMYTDMAPKSS